jgi:hypothetical protein
MRILDNNCQNLHAFAIHEFSPEAARFFTSVSTLNRETRMTRFA